MSAASARDDLAGLLAALRDAATYPDRPARIEVIETHMSWVSLTEHYAYKLKKPVRYAFLDHRSPESREAACHEEVRLNRRLAAHVYLGVLPLARTPDGLRLGGTGEAVDWVVHMRRLSAERMLDARIRSGRLRPGEPRAVAALLARFYAAAPPIPMERDAYVEALARELVETRHELVHPRNGLATEDVDEAVDAGLRALGTGAREFGARVAAGHLVEAHGDLRPEHVALGPIPAVIDCLEFDRRLRTLDPLDELAFLGMECERLGAGWVGRLMRSEYERLTGDSAPDRVVRLYALLRALVRAKLAVWHTRDDGDPERWLARASEYVALARRYGASRLS
jgi:aminoglycoside phosphotransferase family enzyme